MTSHVAAGSRRWAAMRPEDGPDESGELVGWRSWITATGGGGKGEGDKNGILGKLWRKGSRAESWAREM